MIDLSHLSFDDLRKLRESTAEELKARERQLVVDARRRIEEIAQSLGFSMEELLRSKLWRDVNHIPRYQHPSDDSLSWSGQGKQPKWVRDLVNHGTPIEALLNRNLWNKSNADHNHH